MSLKEPLGNILTQPSKDMPSHDHIISERAHYYESLEGSHDHISAKRS